MEFSFYSTVAIMATIFLILLLTMIGLAFNKTKELNFPPSKNTCPDYWTADNTDPTKTVCTISDLNIGTIEIDSNGSYLMTANPNDGDKRKAYTPGYDENKRTVEFSNTSWPAAFSSSGQCALKKWANKYEISWDGVANFNNC